MIFSGDRWEGMIEGYAGERTFCSHCRAQETCMKKPVFPKILPGVRLVLGYLTENARGGMRYPWKGDHRMQPQWFMELYALAERLQRDTTIEKLQRGQDETKNNMG